MNRIVKFFTTWGFPLAFGATYWIFATATDFLNPPRQGVSLSQALFPQVQSLEFLSRLAMLLVSTFGARVFNKVMTRVHKLEQQLYLSEYAVENTKAFAMFWANETGRFIKVNRYAAAKLGYTKEELLQRSIFDITPDHTLAKWQKMLSGLKEKGSVAYATKHRRKDGTEVDCIVHLQYLHTRGNQYQFAFVCDAFQCPIATASHPPCIKSSLPTIDDFLREGL